MVHSPADIETRPGPARGALRYAEVAVARPIDHTLHYKIPGPLSADLRIGSLVEVPLRGQTASGVVVSITDRIDFRGPVKPVRRVLTPDFQITDELIDLGHWIADYYWCSLGEALAAVSFIGMNDIQAKTQVRYALAHPDHWLGVSREVGPEGKKVTPKQALVIRELLASGNTPREARELGESAAVGASVIQTMGKRGWLEKRNEEIERNDPYDRFEARPVKPPKLNDAQSVAVSELMGSVDRNEYQTFLLHGVTGSGKTEVYLRVIEEQLRRGRSSIVLVPEIALTPQTVQTFRERLGRVVAVYHSRLSLGQKYDLWRKIEQGEVQVLVGTRSAIFAPFRNLGTVVVDEEHETTYKQGDTPRYHARDVAVWRASKRGAVAILASATPSLETLHNAREGKYRLLSLPERVGPHAAPVMTVVDMKRHLADGEGEAALDPISPPLLEALEARLAAGEQSILLLNRRGFANQVLCLKCEAIMQCPHCDVSLTFHKRMGSLLCHWCGHREPLAEVCPKCGAAEVQTLGLGTQKIEEFLAERFPKARVIRIDVDTMRGRTSFLEAWRKITEGEIDIILGTQMIAKGFHLEAVTLVGVVSADFALFLPDFRSAERTYNLLTQVAGRAGRGDKPGEVIVQTYIPHHYSIDLAARIDGEEFYRRELHIRKMLQFPPMARLVALLISGEDLELVREQAGRLANMLKSLAYSPHFKNLKVLGPAPAPISRLEDRHRWRILLRGQSPGLLHDLLRQGLEAFGRVHQKSRVTVTVDVDPIDLM